MKEKIYCYFYDEVFRFVRDREGGCIMNIWIRLIIMMDDEYCDDFDVKGVVSELRFYLVYLVFNWVFFFKWS